jgi:hypothetical protein
MVVAALRSSKGSYFYKYIHSQWPLDLGTCPELKHFIRPWRQQSSMPKDR